MTPRTTRRVAIVLLGCTSLLASGCCDAFAFGDDCDRYSYGNWRHHGRCDGIGGDLGGGLAALAIIGGIVLIAGVGQVIFGDHPAPRYSPPYRAAGLPGYAPERQYLYRLEQPGAIPPEPEPPQLCAAH